jgi:hypothetical protein
MRGLGLLAQEGVRVWGLGGGMRRWAGGEGLTTLGVAQLWGWSRGWC